VENIEKCEYCKRKIGSVEPLYSIDISRGNDLEIKFKSVCQDCYARLLNIIDNAEKWRKMDM
jgi:hypothetical protein